ncbi:MULTISPECIES: TIGR03013 family XrtA/PEP-CTERM system glycosyltransferase [Thioalkalivibrio]|uniref:TIGR03013 family XrtA/PEP-CTERM system glycosyltransferase n=1 Tax=Thioalkalivibrio TaxID=106633 RepID=UPI0003642EF2|nr:MULTISPECIES: TIGR03013 family XrtA/PEP-CTERM system glycosyltransferase [Thioalkalivibrio]OOC47789.1 exopolysaccharide biosynthesis polyprenyl glycosylphosphotransferase [Thioalkalivibrio versutus]
MRIFGHYIRRRVLMLAGAELLVAYLCLYAVLTLPPFQPEALSLLDPQLMVATLVVLVVLTLAGLYESDYLATRSTLRSLLRLVPAILVVGGLLLAYGAMVPAALFSPTAVGGGVLLLLTGLVAERTLWRNFSEADAFKRRVLVLGTGSRACAIDTIHPDKYSEELPYRVLGYIATQGEKDCARDPGRHFQLGSDASLLDMAREHRVHEIVVAIRDRRHNLPIGQLLECKLNGVAVTDVSSFFERELQKVQLDSLNASWLIFGEGFRQHWTRNAVKRTFDVLASATLLAATLPVMLATALAIKLESRGPVFYWQTRVGQGNVPFEVCKFRSMREDAEVDGVARWAVHDDDRITRVGRIIRKLRIDELPQVINVFQGSMSFVGPRPERPVFVGQLTEQIPYFPARHTIRPGITGWAQVRYPYGASVEDARQKLQYDLYYVKNHTLFLDILILFETVKVVLFGRGAR